MKYLSIFRFDETPAIIEPFEMREKMYYRIGSSNRLPNDRRKKNVYWTKGDAIQQVKLARKRLMNTSEYCPKGLQTYTFSQTPNVETSLVQSLYRWLME